MILLWWPLIRECYWMANKLRTCCVGSSNLFSFLGVDLYWLYIIISQWSLSWLPKKLATINGCALYLISLQSGVEIINVHDRISLCCLKDFKTVVFHNDWNKMEDTQQEDQNNHIKTQKLNTRKNISINQGCRLWNSGI